MTDEEEKAVIEKTIKGVADLVLAPTLRLWESDPHQFSERPCPTCRSISALVRRPFGCSLMAQVGTVEFRKAINRSR